MVVLQIRASFLTLTHRREESPVVHLPAGAAHGVLPELLHDGAEDRLGRQEAGPSQSSLHARLGDVPDVEPVVVREKGRQGQTFLVHLAFAAHRGVKNKYIALKPTVVATGGNNKHPPQISSRAMPSYYVLLMLPRNVVIRTKYGVYTLGGMYVFLVPSWNSRFS